MNLKENMEWYLEEEFGVKKRKGLMLPLYHKIKK